GSSYSYQAFNRLVTANGATFGYDTNGNLTSKTDASGSWTYSWDYENRLKLASKSGGVTVMYSYDALGRRIQHSSSASGTTKFVYDGPDVVRDLDGSGATLADYLNDAGIDNKLRQTNGGTASYFLVDHLGTTRSLTDTSGNVTSSLGYDSFGSVTSGSASTRYTYTGREMDSDLSLIYYRARWYSPEQGRFISEDPIELQGGVNFYQYVGNNPASLVDPLGLQKYRPPTQKDIEYNCMGWALGILTWVDQGRTVQLPNNQRTSIPKDMPAGKIPGLFGCKWIKCSQKCACSFYKVKVYENASYPKYWHVMRKDCGSDTWTSKEGVAPPAYDIIDPDKHYRDVYPLGGKITAICWCCPKR
ncbi:MAG: RHS repeat domain-containing protein, partial [Pyrinomonadaceae bacterium]